MNTPLTRTRLQAARRGLAIAAAALAALCAAACQRDVTQPTNAARATTAAKPGYKPPPDLEAVTASPGGVLSLVGSAPPGASVRVARPTGPPTFAGANSKGVWRLAVAATPSLLSLSTIESGRVIQAKGYLFVAPDGVAARLRAGGGSEALLASSPNSLVALALDYDDQRAATVSGRAPAGETISLRVDGVERGQAQTDVVGRFVVPLNQPLAAGNHEFELQGRTGEVRFTAPVDAPAPLAGAPLRATRSAGGWRVDWLTPGGGEQTTLLFARPPEASASGL